MYGFIDGYDFGEMEAMKYQILRLKIILNKLFSHL